MAHAALALKPNPVADANHALLVERATFVFGDRLVALNWLYDPNEFLQGRLPIESVTSAEGMESVQKLLTQIEYNVLP